MFNDSLTSRLGSQPCLVCEKKTQSHALVMEYDAEQQQFVSVEYRTDGMTTARMVCHTCYEEYDGDPDRVAALYTAKATKLAARVGKDLDDFVAEAFEQ